MHRFISHCSQPVLGSVLIFWSEHILQVLFGITTSQCCCSWAGGWISGVLLRFPVNPPNNWWAKFILNSICVLGFSLCRVYDSQTPSWVNMHLLCWHPEGRRTNTSTTSGIFWPCCMLISIDLHGQPHSCTCCTILQAEGTELPLSSHPFVFGRQMCITITVGRQNWNVLFVTPNCNPHVSLLLNGRLSLFLHF